MYPGRPQIHRSAQRMIGPYPPARPISPFYYDHVISFAAQPPGRGQARHPGPDDNHGLSLFVRGVGIHGSIKPLRGCQKLARD